MCVLEKVNIATKGLLKMILVRTQKEKRKARENQRPVKDAQLPFSTNEPNFPCPLL